MWQTKKNRDVSNLLPPDNMSIIFLFYGNFQLFVFFSRFCIKLSLFEATNALRLPDTVRREQLPLKFRYHILKRKIMYAKMQNLENQKSMF